jgi:hypothetical protein
MHLRGVQRPAGVTACGLSSSAGVTILADLLRARTSASPQRLMRELYRADIAVRLFWTALGSWVRCVQWLPRPVGSSGVEHWGSGNAMFYIYASCHSSQLVHVQRIDTLSFPMPADGRCGLQAGLRSTRQGASVPEESAHASRSPERLSPSLRPSTVVIASAWSLRGIGSITLTTRNVARASLRARMTGAESLEPVPLAGLNLIASMPL